MEDVERGLVFHPGLDRKPGEAIEDPCDVVAGELDGDRAVLALADEDRCARLHPEPIAERLRNHDLTFWPDLGQNWPTALEGHDTSKLV